MKNDGLSLEEEPEFYNRRPDPIREPALECALPSSPEAECAVLGAIILDNGLIAQAADLLTPSDFYVDRKSTRLNSSHIQKSRMPSSA